MVDNQSNCELSIIAESLLLHRTIMGTSRFLKEKDSNIQIVGLQPSEGSSIAGIRRWPKEYLPKIFDVRFCSPC